MDGPGTEKGLIKGEMQITKKSKAGYTLYNMILQFHLGLKLAM